MAVPPGGSAGIRAELSGFPLGNDLDALSAVLTKDGVLRGISIQAVATAEGTDGVIGNSQGLANLHVSKSLQAHELDLFHFIGCHRGSSDLRICYPHSPLRIEKAFWKKEHKKRSPPRK